MTSKKPAANPEGAIKGPYGAEPLAAHSDRDTNHARYKRAQYLMQGARTQSVVQNDTLSPYWIEGSDCFWYQRTYKDRSSSAIDTQYRLVDAAAGTNQPAFDHQALATALAEASAQAVKPGQLPISDITLNLAPLTVSFTAFEQRWRFDARTEHCQALESSASVTDISIDSTSEVLSPNGKQIAFLREHNLWLRDLASGQETPLTEGGEEDFSYGAPGSPYGVSYFEPGVLWSPDSRRVLLLQRDRREVLTLPIVDHVPEDGSLRPQLEQVKVAYPGDKHIETYRVLAIEAASGKQCLADYPQIPAGAGEYGGFFSPNQQGWWSKDNRHAYFIEQERGDQVLRLVAFDTDTGATRVLFEERSSTHILVKPESNDLPLHVPLPETEELIWWSQRSGWGHLYLYNLKTGELTQTLTQGDWSVRDILSVDTERRELWLQTAGRTPGRNPYYRDIARLHIDSGQLTTLVSSDHEHVVRSNRNLAIGRPEAVRVNNSHGLSPNGQYLVATRTRADAPPVHLLFDRRGKQQLEIEATDISHLPAGWHWPEPVTVKAADQQTDICGVLFRPSGFAEDQRYPLINMIVSGPWLNGVTYGSFHNCRGYVDRYYFQAAALAELGFMVLILDSRGTPLRDKAFLDSCYGWTPDSANTQDHRSAIEQLAQRYPSIDKDRLGIFSPTGYDGAIQNLMECPDLYSVGVINMHQDSRFITGVIEGDKYQGVDGPASDRCFPEQLVDQWQGKLLLVHPLSGGFIGCYPAVSSLRLVEALRQANKDVDMLLMPHHQIVMSSYEMRRCWDYLVKHLRASEPPEAFELGEFNW